MKIFKAVLVTAWVNGQDFSVKDPDLVETTEDCLNCISSIGDHFCQKPDSISSGWCCRGGDCSLFGTEFGFCSNKPVVSTIKLMSCPY